MKPPGGATVTFLSGPRDGETVSLPVAGGEAEAVIGRAAGCALVLSDDPDVSREHARLTWQDDGWQLEDLGSRNGTFIGEFAAARRIDVPARLEPGALFRVGNTRLRLEEGQPPRTRRRAQAEAPIS